MTVLSTRHDPKAAKIATLLISMGNYHSDDRLCKEEWVMLANFFLATAAAMPEEMTEKDLGIHAPDEMCCHDLVLPDPPKPPQERT